MPYVRPSTISTTAIIEKGLVEHIDYPSNQRQETPKKHAIDVSDDNTLGDRAPNPRPAPSPSPCPAHPLDRLNSQSKASHSITDQAPAIDNPAKPPSIPSADPLSSRSISRRFTITDLTPPMPVSSANLLASNFAGLGLGAGQSDTVVTRLKDAVEGETISLQNGQSDAAGLDLALKNAGPAGDREQGDIPSDKPILPPSLPSASMSSATPTTSLPQLDANQSRSQPRRESDDLSVPDLVPSGISSTSLDTMHDTPSPIVPELDDRVVVVGGANEGEGDEVEVEVDGVDPKLVAINKYKEGLYTYTRGLWLEAKSSSSRTDKRRASMSTGTAPSGSFGYKQSGMERLAAKKALARRLNA